MKIHQDCKEYESIGCILARDMVRFFLAHGVVNPRIGEIYFEGVEPKKQIDKEITAAILEELGVGGKPL